jgi:hypothetical protein
LAYWSRRTILILLTLLVLISLTLRYPLVEHERYQTDSYFIHHLSASIVDDGMAKWTYHPLSYVGYYPLSYPSGAPFLLAEFSVMSGLTVEQSILVADMFVSVVFCFAVFMTARYLMNKPELAVLAALLAILGSRFVDTTYWDGSARGPAVAMMILVVAVTLRFSYSWDLRSLAICASFIVGCFLLHHMAVLLLLFGVAYVLTVTMTRYVLARLRTKKRSLAVLAVVAVASLVITIPFLFFDYFWESAVRGMQGSPLFDTDSEFLTVLFVGVTSYTNQIGFVLVFALAYVLVLLRRFNFSPRILLPVFLVTVLIPIFGETLYVSMLLSPFVAILGTLWFDHAFKAPRKRRRAAVILAVLLAVSIVHPLWSLDRWSSDTFLSGDSVLVENQVYNDAIYMIYVDDPSLYGTSNCLTVEMCLQALSGVGFLSGSGIALTLNGDVTKEDLSEAIQQSSHKFPKNIYNWYEYDNPLPVDRYVRYLMINGVSYLYEQGLVDGATDYFATHSNIVSVVDNRWSSEYVTQSSITDATLPEELAASKSLSQDSVDSPQLLSYKYYESELVSMYLTQLPIPG